MNKTSYLAVTAFFSVALLFALLSCSGCGQVPLDKDNSSAGIANLNTPTNEHKAEPQPLAADATPEEIWRNRCGECHAPEKGIEKFHGEQWELVIGKMIKKQDAHFTDQLAQKAYQYLYERTKLPEDPPWTEVIAGRSQWSTKDEASDTTSGAGAKSPPKTGK